MGSNNGRRHHGTRLFAITNAAHHELYKKFIYFEIMKFFMNSQTAVIEHTYDLKKLIIIFFSYNKKSHKSIDYNSIKIIIFLDKKIKIKCVFNIF